MIAALVALILAIVGPIPADDAAPATRMMGHGATVTEVPGQRGGIGTGIYEYGPDRLNNLTYLCTNTSPGSIEDGIAVRQGAGPTVMILTPEPGEVHACDPSVVKLPDGRWLLTYTSAVSTAGENSVRAAVSSSATGPFTRVGGPLVDRAEEPPGRSGTGAGYRWGQSAVFLHPTRTPAEGDLVMLVTFGTNTEPPAQFVTTLNSETLTRVSPMTRVRLTGLPVGGTYGGDVAYLSSTGDVAMTYSASFTDVEPRFLAHQIGVATKPLAAFLANTGTWTPVGVVTAPPGQTKIHNEAIAHNVAGHASSIHLLFGAVDDRPGSWLFYRLMEATIEVETS